MAAYADAWLGTASPLAADAVTVHPYLGLGSLAPLVEAAAANGRGVFVVVRSSNPEGRDLQQAVTAGGPAVEDMLLGEIAGAQRLARGPRGHRRARSSGPPWSPPHSRCPSSEG